jgi:hypothetical protein
MRVGVQRTRRREVFSVGPVECMGAVYSHADRKLSTLMHGECMGAGYWHGGQRAIDTDTISRLVERGWVRA